MLEGTFAVKDIREAYFGHHRVAARKPFHKGCAPSSHPYCSRYVCVCFSRCPATLLYILALNKCAYHIPKAAMIFGNVPAWTLIFRGAKPHATWRNRPGGCQPLETPRNFQKEGGSRSSGRKTWKCWHPNSDFIPFDLNFLQLATELRIPK